jgi:O-antigen/teichoic acid export membrane protein
MFKKIMETINARLPRRDSLGATLIKGVLGTAGIRLVHAALGLVTAIVLAKMLKPSGYGTYSFVMVLVAFLAIPSELGVPGLAVREIAVTNARKDWSHMRGFIIRAHRTIIVTCLCLVGAAVVALLVWGDRLDATKRACIWLGLLVIPLMSLGALRGAMLRGLRKVVLGQLPEQIIRPLVLLTLVLLLPLLGKKLDSPVGVMAVQIISVTTAFLCGLILFFRNRPPELAGAEPQFGTASLLKSSIPFGLSAAMQLINGRTDILALGMFREDAEVGIYRVAVQIAAVIIFSSQAVNAIQAPHIAHLYANGDMQKLQRIITRSSQAVTLYAVPILLAIVFFGESVIRALFGAEYITAHVPLVILGVGQLVNVSMGSVASLLNMTGHERDTARIILIAAMLNVVLTFTLTPVWGMTGAAVATASGLIVWNLIMWRAVYVRTGIESSPFGLWTKRLLARKDD